MNLRSLRLLRNERSYQAFNASHLVCTIILAIHRPCFIPPWIHIESGVLYILILCSRDVHTYGIRKDIPIKLRNLYRSEYIWFTRGVHAVISKGLCSGMGIKKLDKTLQNPWLQIYNANHILSYPWLGWLPGLYALPKGIPSLVGGCLFNIFTANLHDWRPCHYPPPVTPQMPGNCLDTAKIAVAVHLTHTMLSI